MYRYTAIISLPILLALCGCDSRSAAAPNDKAGNVAVTVGPYSLDIPANWKAWESDELSQLNQQYQTQQRDIYRRYNGVENPSTTTPLAAYRTPSGATFICAVISVPPQADLMGQLKREVPDKAKWGIKQGYIRRASEVVPVSRDGFDGFYVEMEDTAGVHNFVGGLVHTSLKSQVVQVTLLGLCTAEARQKTIDGLLGSVRLSRAATTQPAE